MDFPKLNGPAHYSGSYLKEFVATKFAVMSLRSLWSLQLLVATFFVLCLAVGSRDLMSSVTTLFFLSQHCSLQLLHLVVGPEFLCRDLSYCLSP